MKDITKLSPKDLEKKLVEARVKLRELRFSVANNQLKKVREIREVRRTIAQLLTTMKKNSTNTAPVAETAETDKDMTKS